MPSTDLISVAAIIVGFGVTAIMFRVQRELHVLEDLKIKLLWLAWADYLILASVALAVLGVIVPLLVVPSTSPTLLAFTAALCVAAAVLQAGYIPSILAHYRIQFDAKREGPRAKGEPVERRFVVTTVIAAALASSATLWLHLAPR
jgi:hypothetical protein